MAQEIESPPFPGQWVTADVIFEHLVRLAKWVDAQRDDLNETAGQELIPKVTIPLARDQVGYVKRQPVFMQVRHLFFIRHVREVWDGILRDFEDAWETKPCLRLRLVLLQNAAVLINDALTSHELREARAQDEVEQMRKVFDGTVLLLQQLGETKHAPPPDFSSN